MTKKNNLFYINEKSIRRIFRRIVSEFFKRGLLSRGYPFSPEIPRSGIKVANL
jgi:hypothetical protein